MAAGFPVKQNYAAGDVLTAAQMNDLSSTLNYLDPTAKGDLFPASSGTALTRLAVGNNGETLVADSSTATGLRYQAPKTQNAIYNSGFDIAQRGTSFTGLAGADYTLDRWNFWSTTGGQSNYASQQNVGNLSVTPNQATRFCGRFGRTAGTTNTGGRVLFQTLETNDSVRFAGQTVTFSFYARAGANYSAASMSLGYGVTQGTGTDQIYYSFTGGSAVISATATLTTSWQRFTATGTVATNTTQLAPTFTFAPTGTAGAADYFEITGVQLEVGSVATPYNRMSGTIQGELAACQRYFNRLVSGAAAVGTLQAIATVAAIGTRSFPTMRTAPVVTISSPSHFTLRSATNTTITTTVFNCFNINSQAASPYFEVASGLVAGNATECFSFNVSATLDLSAEL